MRVLFSLLRAGPRVLRPTLHARDAAHVPYARLRDEHGVGGVVFDKDGTLTGPETEALLEGVTREALDESVAVFGKERVAVASNTAGSSRDPTGELADRTEALLGGVHVVRHGAKKPDPAVLRAAAEQLQVPVRRLAVVGDRRLTDVAAANLAGCVSVLTEPQGGADPNPFVRYLLRPLENAFAGWR